MKCLLTFSILFFAVVETIAQGTRANWFFGSGKGIVFSETSIEVNVYNQQATLENCVSISDKNGNLLFYSNGETVWDSTHNVMPNGDSLLGCSSSAKGLVALQDPENLSRYFIASIACIESSFPWVPQWINPNFIYSVVDMSLNSGLGDVDTNYKNVWIYDSLYTEQLVSTPGRGLFSGSHWLITRGHESNLLVFNLSENGVFLHSDTFFLSGLNYSRSEMSISPNGNYIASKCLGDFQAVEFLKFNPSTGKFYGLDTIHTPWSSGFLQFSPESKFLYNGTRKCDTVECHTYITRFHLDNYVVDTLFDSLYPYPAYLYYSDAALDPQENIRVLQYPNSESLSTIYYPDSVIGVVQFIPEDLVFDTALGQIYHRFPRFAFDVSPSIELSSEVFCFSDTAYFYLHPEADSVVWNFGDFSSGINNQATGNKVSHLFTDTGWFNISVIVDDPLFFDTLHLQIYVNPTLQSEIPDTVQICLGDTFNPDLDHLKGDFFWLSTGNSNGITPEKSGWETYSFNSVCDSIIDSVFIGVDTIYSFKLEDILICIDDSVTISADSSLNFNWSTGEYASSIIIGSWMSLDLAPFEISYTYNNVCGLFSDTLSVDIVPIPNADWFSDSVLCSLEEPIVLPPSLSNTEFILQDSKSDTMSIPWIISQSGEYLLTAMTSCDTIIRTAYLSPNQVINVSLPSKVELCSGEEVVLDVSWPNSSYNWYVNGVMDTSKMDSAIQVFYPATIEIIEVEIISPPCAKRIETQIYPMSADSCAPCAFEVPNVFSPNGDGLNDVLQISNACSLQKFTFFIYNRWGQLVYSSNQSIPEWDGSFQNAVARNGVYYIIIEYVDTKGELRSVRNSITLLR